MDRVTLSSLWVAALLTACQPSSDSPTNEQADATREPATFVGGRVCGDCHADEAAGWTGSHHDLAMQVARTDTVLGDFNDATFTYNDVVTAFFRRGDEYWVRTDGSDGSARDFRITHVFGVEPLQQYLIPQPGGRYQALSIAWDTRPTDAGGQRWFHLYPDEAIDHTDPLHWTGTLQSWNLMCAECHSTNLRKNYLAEENAYETTWSSLDVDCEACHGPGSLHVAAPAEARLVLGSKTRTWVFADDTGIAQRVPALSAHDEVETCARCHARRAQFSDDHEAGEPFLDAYRPALLDTDLYHADGQILEEVYVYGSFLQSVMHEAGVSCSDCHDPHSARLRLEGNALCGQCHLAARFDTPEHHHHSPGRAGANCIDCHMRAETYMVVDPRRDHSFRVPRPDLSARLDTPNACNDCHRDQAPQWAADRVALWYSSGRHNEFHYGQAIHAGRTWAADRAALLRRVVADRQLPAIVRATAVDLMADQIDGEALDLLETILLDDEPIVQLAALEALQGVPLGLRIPWAQRFLSHPMRVLRMDAARALLPIREQLSERRQDDLDAAIDEYIEARRFDSDRAEGLFNLGSVLAQLERAQQAERTFRDALEREPTFAPTYVNLADLYRSQGREQDAEQLLRDGVSLNPDDPSLRLALGLSLVRSEQLDEALEMLSRASQLAPDSPHYSYVLGVALNSTDQGERGVAVLRSTHERFPGHRETLVALATILRDSGDVDEATRYAQALLTLSPSDATARALLDELDGTPAARVP